MAVVNTLKNKQSVMKGGSSLLALGLTAVQAQEALDDPAETGGWYPIGYLEGSEMGPERETEELRDEADELIEETVNTDEFVITTTLLNTDDKTLKLLNWLEDNGVPARYPLPTKNTEDTGEYQWWFFPNLRARKENWRLSTARAETRKRQATLVATRSGTDPIYQFATLPSDQTDAAWTDYADYKDTALPGA